MDLLTVALIEFFLDCQNQLENPQPGCLSHGSGSFAQRSMNHRLIFVPPSTLFHCASEFKLDREAWQSAVLGHMSDARRQLYCIMLTTGGVRVLPSLVISSLIAKSFLKENAAAPPG
jgi:hypothetical protein